MVRSALNRSTRRIRHAARAIISLRLRRAATGGKEALRKAGLATVAAGIIFTRFGAPERYFQHFNSNRKGYGVKFLDQRGGP